jgi:hypothetical protein
LAQLLCKAASKEIKVERCELGSVVNLSGFLKGRLSDEMRGRPPLYAERFGKQLSLALIQADAIRRQGRWLGLRL